MTDTRVISVIPAKFGMPTASADTKTIRELLPDLEAAADRLEENTVAMLICAFHGTQVRNWTMNRQQNDSLFITSTAGTEIMIDRDRCPDVDLETADRLVRDLLPGWNRNYMLNDRDEKDSHVYLTPPDVLSPGHHGIHRKPAIAILIALSGAVLAKDPPEMV